MTKVDGFISALCHKISNVNFNGCADMIYVIKNVIFSAYVSNVLWYLYLCCKMLINI